MVEVDTDLLTGIREGFLGEVIFILNIEREIKIYKRGKVRGHLSKSKSHEQRRGDSQVYGILIGN